MNKWKPSKLGAAEYGDAMKAIEQFCVAHNISASKSSDSYYFTVNDINYRVSNHSIEASDRGMDNQFTEGYGRESYHPDGRADIVCIHAGKTRIIEIYNAIATGSKVNGRGNIL